MNEDFKEAVRQRSDIVEVISSYVTLKKAGNSFKACCPFHQEKTPSFTVSPERQAFYCFGCQKGGDVFRFIMEREGVDFLEARDILARRAGMQIPEWHPDSSHARPAADSGATRSGKAALFELHEKIAAWFQSNLRKKAGKIALDYVRNRGLNDDLLTQFGIGYAPESWDAAREWGRKNGFTPEQMLLGGLLTRKDETTPPAQAYDRFRHRLMFPIWDAQGRIVGFSGRVLDQEAKGGKYVNSPETPIFHKSRLLYALPLARQGIRRLGYALLCEGQLDVIACHSAGFDNAIAPQGTAFTEEQARLIKRYTDTLVLAFDADQAGQNAAAKSSASFLPAGLHAKVAIMEPGEDPDSLVRKGGAEALQEKLNQAQDFILFLLNREAAQRDISSPQEKGEAVNAVLQVVRKISNSVARSEYCDLIAAQLGIRRDSVFQQLHRLTRQAYAQVRRSKSGTTPTPEIPEPLVTQEDRPEIKAEAVLLDLALHHQSFADRLLGELPPSMISDTPVGHALNEILAYASQGEWEHAEDFLIQPTTDGHPLHPLVAKALFNPDFDQIKDPRQLDKACNDCLWQIKNRYLTTQINQLRAKMRQESSRTERQALQQQILDRTRERQKLKR